MKKKIFWCKNCLSMSTRPRITFDKRGFCSACLWSEEKKKLNWKKRQDNLKKILNQNKINSTALQLLVGVKMVHMFLTI